ncbi:MAG: hypothetical protein AAGB01_04645 [Cyanobacteria bacterium P01_F01_bin.42]
MPLSFNEMAVVIAIEKQDAKMLSPEFLAQCGIVPREWELATKPVVTDVGTIIRYKNNFAIASNPKQVQIVQPFSGQPGEVKIVQMAKRYCQILNTLIYKAVGINFKAFVDLGNIADQPNEYILKFLDPERINTKPVKASLSLSYVFARNTLNLSIMDASLNSSGDGKAHEGIMFVGNCETRFEITDQSQVQAKIDDALNSWEIDFARYSTIVTDFLR